MKKTDIELVDRKEEIDELERALSDLLDAKSSTIFFLKSPSGTKWKERSYCICRAG